MPTNARIVPVTAPRPEGPGASSPECKRIFFLLHCRLPGEPLTQPPGLVSALSDALDEGLRPRRHTPAARRSCSVSFRWLLSTLVASSECDTLAGFDARIFAPAQQLNASRLDVERSIVISMRLETAASTDKPQKRTFGSPPILPPHQWAGLPAYLFIQKREIPRRCWLNQPHGVPLR